MESQRGNEGVGDRKQKKGGGILKAKGSNSRMLEQGIHGESEERASVPYRVCQGKNGGGHAMTG